jgi:hypothetical protein
MAYPLGELRQHDRSDVSLAGATERDGINSFRKLRRLSQIMGFSQMSEICRTPKDARRFARVPSLRRTSETHEIRD